VIFKPARSLRSLPIVAVAAVLGPLALGLGGCASSEETDADLPRPEAQARPTYKTPPTRKTAPPKSLGRIVDETERRRQVIWQLDQIFKSSNP
jgi:hypothetical protein